MSNLTVSPFRSKVSAKINNKLIEAVKQVEEKLGVRIGIAVYDEEAGRNWQYPC